MNGTQNSKDAPAQKPPQGAPAPPPAAAPANGNSALNKKRKKDGLKPIITTEGPGYVHASRREQSKLLAFVFVLFLLSFSIEKAVSAPPNSAWLVCAHPLLSIPGCEHTLRISVAGCDGRAMGPHEPRLALEGNHAPMLRHHTCLGAWVVESPGQLPPRTTDQPVIIFWRVWCLCVARVSRGASECVVAPPPESFPPHALCTVPPPTPPANKGQDRHLCRLTTVTLHLTGCMHC